MMDIDSWETAGALLLYSAVKVPAEEAGKIIGDCLKVFRIKNLARMYITLDKVLKKRGIDPAHARAIKANFGLPLLEAASLNEDQTLQELWAKLFANAMDPNFEESLVRNSFIDIIKSLDPLDVKILKYCHDVLLDNNSHYGARKHLSIASMLTLSSFDAPRIRNVLEIDDTAYELSVYNLLRMQCITIHQPDADQSLTATPVKLSNKPNSIELTPLGYYFILACIA